MCKICWTSLTAAILVIAFVGYKIMYPTAITPSADGRMAIELTASERDLVLTEMRDFLISVQTITEAVATENMEMATKAARKAGTTAQGAVPLSLVSKLPNEFKKLGFDTHQQFDQIGLDAEQLGDGSQTIKQLSTIMQNCISCHAGYKLVAVADK
jgi:hypothetical protein